MYDILGKFNNLDPKMTPVKESAKTEPVYENVEPRGSIMEAVASLAEKYMGFKAVEKAAKAGGAENPAAVAASIGRKKYGKKKFQKAAAAGKKLGEAAKPDFLDVDKDGNKKETFKKAVADKKKAVKESANPAAKKGAQAILQALSPEEEQQLAAIVKQAGNDPKRVVQALGITPELIQQTQQGQVAEGISASLSGKVIQALWTAGLLGAVAAGVGGHEIIAGNLAAPILMAAGAVWGGGKGQVGYNPDADKKRYEKFQARQKKEYDARLNKQNGLEESGGPYELYNPKHPKFAANYKKFKAKNPNCKLEDFIAAMKKKEHGVNEGVVDSVVNRAKEKYHDVQANRYASKHAELSDTDKEKSKEYADIANQHKFKRQELTKKRTGSTSKYYGEGEYDPAPINPEAVAKRKRLQALKDRAEDEGDIYAKEKNTPIRKVAGKAYGGSAQVDAPEKDELDEKAVSKAQQKFMGMVYATKKGEKAPSKAVAKAAKGMTKKAAHDFAKTKHKGLPQHVTESRVAESSEYTYETVARILCDENPNMDVDSQAFAKAVYDELIQMKLTPKSARWLINYDEDFMGDTATTYGYFCREKAKEMAECDAPLNSHLGGSMEELDEIAKLAGLPTKEATCMECGMLESSCSCAHEEELDEREQFQSMPQGYASGTPAAPAVNPNAKPTFDKSKLNPMREEEMEEGNEFSGALAAAKAAGKKEFEVDGKKYTVKEDINVNISANGEQDALNLIRRLSGLDEQEPMVQDPVQGEVPLRDIPVAMDVEDAIAQGIIEPAEEVDEERDIEYTNTPREETAGIDSQTQGGDGDVAGKSKKMYSKEYMGDNHMAVKEEALWKAYESMINDVKE